jgi:hypothetical protein
VLGYFLGDRLPNRTPSCPVMPDLHDKLARLPFFTTSTYPMQSSQLREYTLEIFMTLTVTSSISRRDPRIVSYFRPYMHGDVVTLGNKDWQLLQGMKGWYLTDTGDHHGAHDVVKNINAMIDLIRQIEIQFMGFQPPVFH